MGPHFDFTVVPKYPYLAQIRYYTKRLEQVNTKGCEAYVYRVMTVFNDLLIDIQEQSLPPERLKKYRAEMLKFSTVLFHLTWDKEFPPHCFLWTYLKFMAPVKRARYESQFFQYLCKKFVDPIPNQELDKFLVRICQDRSDHFFYRYGRQFIKKRMQDTPIDLYKTFLRTLLDFNHKRHCDLNQIIWSIYYSNNPEHASLRRRCAKLFSFLVKEQGGELHTPPTKVVNRNIHWFVDKFIKDNLLAIIPGCFRWRGLKKSHLVTYLLISDLNVKGIRAVLLNIADAFERGMQLKDIQVKRIKSLVEGNTQAFMLIELYRLIYLLARYNVNLSQETMRAVEDRFFMEGEEGEERQLRPFSSEEVVQVKLALKAIKEQGLKLEIPTPFQKRFYGMWSDSVSITSSSESCEDTASSSESCEDAASS